MMSLLTSNPQSVPEIVRHSDFARKPGRTSRLLKIYTVTRALLASKLVYLTLEKKIKWAKTQNVGCGFCIFSRFLPIIKFQAVFYVSGRILFGCRQTVFSAAKVYPVPFQMYTRASHEGSGPKWFDRGNTTVYHFMNIQNQAGQFMPKVSGIICRTSSYPSWQWSDLPISVCQQVVLVKLALYKFICMYVCFGITLPYTLR